MVTADTAIRKAKQSLQSQELSNKKILEMYQQMVLIRRFEEKAGQLYGMGLIGGFCHLYIGQEAVVVGMQDCINTGQDQVITTYRDHGHMIACGTELNSIFAELLGKETGCSRGKGGSMHMFDLKNEFYGGHGIVGANVPIGAGLALSNKYQENGNICLTYFGDGAANQGQVYEAFNMAALWELPVIFIIENNEYAMGTSVQRSTSAQAFYKRGEAFGIKGTQVNGQDVLAVREAGLEAVDYVRSGNGPMIMEMNTYRYRGHSMSDPANYRSKEEVQRMREYHDPIEGLKEHILEQDIAKEDELKAIDKDCKERVKQSAEFAQNAPEPAAHELFTDVLR